ncbi:MAG TPA: hypothetical protein P5338_11395, partial [Bacteroidales bacterium]|nr:hypothetical protein [Bacteroidales bacterium]
MIEESVKIHDRYSIEIKLGFNARRKSAVSDFAVNTWLFIPNSLDINPLTYEKKDFYRDVRSNIRLITPVYLLRDIAGEQNTPFVLLQKSFENLASHPSRTHTAEFEYQIKMFLSILKSALRDDLAFLSVVENHKDKKDLIAEYLETVHTITSRFRSLRKIINVSTIKKSWFEYFQFGDEFMSNLVEQYLFKLVENIETCKEKEFSGLRKKVIQIIQQETAYRREKGYPVVEKKDPHHNRELILRLGSLKKFAENELFLTTNKKRDGVLVEQIYYSIAAGLSMVFATAIAFSFQMRYGNFTIPFFVALVVSYMLKDRIKELGRYYFAHRLGKRYFDHKTRISLKDIRIGWSKEAMDYIPEGKVPPEVVKIRNRIPILQANNRWLSERIILYRKLIRIYRPRLDEAISYSTTGIHDIIRLNISSFVTKMDDPGFPLYRLDEDDSLKTLKGERAYFLNLVMQ